MGFNSGFKGLICDRPLVVAAGCDCCLTKTIFLVTYQSRRHPQNKYTKFSQFSRWRLQFQSTFNITSLMFSLSRRLGLPDFVNCPLSGFGTQVRGFAPGRNRRSLKAKKILSTPSFGGKVKPSPPCRSFTACKRSINVTCESAFRQNSRTFLRRFLLSRGDKRGDAWWRKLECLTKIPQ